MSVARLVATMAQTPFASYIGSASHNETTSDVPLPASAQVGDFCIIQYSSARTLSGGAGVAWTSTTDPNGWTRIDGRQLLAGDFSTPLVLNAASPVIVMIWRGPVAISAARTSGTGSVGGPPAVSSFSMTGFTKSARAVAIAGFAVGVNASGELLQPPFQASAQVGPVNLRIKGYSMTSLANYTNGAAISCDVSSGPGTADAIVFELLG